MDLLPEGWQLLSTWDQNTVQVHGPTTNVARQLISLRRVTLTDYTVQIPLNAREKTIKAALAKNNVIEKFGQSAWGRKLESAKKRAASTDFDRFQVMVERRKRAYVVNQEVRKLKKAKKA